MKNLKASRDFIVISFKLNNLKNYMNKYMLITLGIRFNILLQLFCISDLVHNIPNY